MLSKRADKIHKTKCREFPQSRKPNSLKKLPLLLLGAKAVPESRRRGRVKVQIPLTAVLCISLILSLVLLPACREGWEEKAAMQKHYSYVTEEKHTQSYF